MLALFVSNVVTFFLADWQGYEWSHGQEDVNRSFADIVGSLVPSNIFEPFVTISPIPLIFVALLLTYALCSAGKDFDVLKTAIDACYGMFSRMLSAIIAVLPIGCFLSIMDVLLEGGHETLVYTMALLLIAVISGIVIVAEEHSSS